VKQLTQVKVQQTTAKVDYFTMGFFGSVDVSSSMSGTKLSSAIEGLQAIHGAMRPNDVFALLTFATTVRKLHHAMAVKKVDLSRDVKNIRANAGGCTALYDALKASVQQIKEYHLKAGRPRKHKYNLLCLTDGADNNSSTSFDAIKKLLAEPGVPNVNATIIFVGQDDDYASKMRDLCSAKHLHFWYVKDVNKLKSKLRQYAKSISIEIKRLSFSSRGHGFKKDYADRILISGKSKSARKALRKIK